MTIATPISVENPVPPLSVTSDAATTRSLSDGEVVDRGA